MLDSNKMGYLQARRKSFVFTKWIICSWSMITAVAVFLSLCSPVLAVPANDALYDYGDDLTTATSTELGSGHGGLMDVLGYSDDDDDYDDYSDYAMGGFDDDGGGGGGGDGDGGGSTMFPGGNGKGFPMGLDLPVGLDIPKVTCYHCLGDGVRGCDVVAMLHDVKSYTMSCIGKCLNISSGLTAVYDCAHDMTSKTDTCFKNGDTEMCFCSGDLCNGPGNAKKFFSHNKTPFFFQRHNLTFGKPKHADNINDYDYEGIGRNGYENSSRSKDREYNSNDNRTIVYDDYNYGNDSEIGWKSLSGGKEGDNVSRSKGSFLENSRNNKDKEFPYVQQAEIDVIIPGRKVGKIDNNSTSEENGTPQPVNIENMPIGNIKDSDHTAAATAAVSGENFAVESVSYNVMVLVCSVLFTKSLL